MMIRRLLLQLMAPALGLTMPMVANAAGEATLRVTITDAATVKPTACTVALVNSQGNLITEGMAFSGGFRCDGRFEKRLPAGRTRLRITRGHETRAVERELHLTAGEVVELKVTLERIVNLRRRGWYAGDSHAHMIHGERTIPVTFDDVAQAVRAEDLQYFSLAHDWSLEKPTPEKLSAALAARSTPDCVLTWNLEAPKNYYKGDAGRCLGHCWSVGMRGRTARGEDVIPILLAASAHDYESAKPTYANFESHQLIRSLGGAVSYSHPARWWWGAWGGQGGYPRVEKMRVSNLAVELPLDTLLGPTYDGVDIFTSAGEAAANQKAFELWALLLNHGYRIAPTASSDSCFDRPGGATPGSARTYTFLTGDFSLEKVTRALAAGRNFITTGPLLVALVNGQPPGAVFPTDGQPHRLEIEAWASGADTNGLRRIELLRNGETNRIFTFNPRQTSEGRTNVVLQETNAAWYCVRLIGGDQRQRAYSGVFFFDPPGWKAPARVPATVQARIVEAGSGKLLAGTITEITYLGTLPQPGKPHAIPDGEGQLVVPGTVRLRAEVPGHRALTLSPVLDYPPLAEAITRLEDKDLLDWQTYERVRALLGSVRLTFTMEKLP